MINIRKIEILESDKNSKGDLFGRLMGDFFHAIGYGEPRFNIHKTGREIDLQTEHRVEKKIAIAEFKAHESKIGGDEINKFVGILDLERKKLEKNSILKNHTIIGYFISLSGFKETALEQERELDGDRVNLIKPDKIIEELIKGKVIVGIEKAIASLRGIFGDLSLLDYVDLIAYTKGWIWVIYFSNNGGQSGTHFSLVHAEGKPLIESIFNEIVLLDKNLSNNFQGLSALIAKNKEDSTDSRINDTKEKYFKYLENELGDIQFEGMPTDKEAGSVRIKLENIFVPLHLIPLEQNQKIKYGDVERNEIGSILEKNSRLAILAKPGGGKSTLIKRIAIAYAFPERRKQINDKLPDRDWFPIFIRCRELGEKVTFSITEIINSIPSRAELSNYNCEFSDIVSDALQNGNGLLLIDGLDEISDDRSRIFFVNQLRTFLSTYPTVSIIVTSREAGFRAVGGSLAAYCNHYKVANLIDLEIEDLCIKWHKAIIDESENTVKEAKKISDIIINDKRIQVLAENPLLLTTLLFVKRWAGYLPTKRSVLYQEMIKLLLVTWNVEGHEKLDIEETEPQLAFVAYWMTSQGKQTISSEELTTCLVNARKQMPEILDYTNISPSEFIQRVESRSSLLIMAGHTKTPIGITQIYEFLHLSFQEYLTAKAIVKKYLPQEYSKLKMLEILKPNINKENWKEVIPLVAVLLERDSKELIEYLIEESKKIALDEKIKDKKQTIEKLAPSLLGSCLANEIQINTEVLGNAIEWYAKNNNEVRDSATTEIITKSKFKKAFIERVKINFFDPFDEKFAAPLGSILGETLLIENIDNENLEKQILSMIYSNDRSDICIGLLSLMILSFSIHSHITLNKYRRSLDIISSQNTILFDYLLKLLNNEDNHINFCICWCLSWAVNTEVFPDEFRNSYTTLLINKWQKITLNKYKRVNTWAVKELLIPSYKVPIEINHEELKAYVNKIYINPENEYDKYLSIALGHILGIERDKTELYEFFKSEREKRIMLDENDNTYKFMNELGIVIEEEKKEAVIVQP